MDFKASIFFKVFFRKLFISIALGLVIYFGGFLTGLLNMFDYGVLGSITAVLSLIAAVPLDRGKEDVPEVHVKSGNNDVSQRKSVRKIPYEKVLGSFLSYFAFLFILINYFPLIYGTLCNYGPIFNIPFIIIAVVIMLIELLFAYRFFSKK